VASTRALTADAAALGLRRTVVVTGVGEVVVRVGREAGGPATVLLHGAAGSWTTWTPLITEADRRGRPLTDLVVLDLPGWGESRLPERAADVPAMSDAVAQVAEDLGYRNWTLIGHSLGGVIALELGARRPESTLAVGLVSPTGAEVLDAIRRPLRGVLRLPAFAGILLAMRTLSVFRAATGPLLHLAHRLGLLRLISRPLFADPSGVDSTVTAAFAEEIRPVAFARAARASAHYDIRSWARVTCPVRSVRGERDAFVGEGDAAVLARLLPDFRERRLRGAGHFAAIEQPGAVLDVLRPATTVGV
jgi:pimeloyl-ACP methyl ester carboxylesterase